MLRKFAAGLGRVGELRAWRGSEARGFAGLTLEGPSRRGSAAAGAVRVWPWRALRLPGERSGESLRGSWARISGLSRGAGAACRGGMWRAQPQAPTAPPRLCRCVQRVYSLQAGRQGEGTRREDCVRVVSLAAKTTPDESCSPSKIESISNRKSQLNITDYSVRFPRAAALCPRCQIRDGEKNKTPGILGK